MMVPYLRCVGIVLILLLVASSESRRVKRGGGGRQRPSGDDGNQSDVGPEDEIIALRKLVDVSYLRCAFHNQALLRVPSPDVKTTSTSKKHRFPFFLGVDGQPTAIWKDEARSNVSMMSEAHPEQQRNAVCEPTANCTANPCGLQWIEDSELYSGLDAIILVGDSTLLRLFQHIIRAKKDDYEAKVGDLEEDFLNRTLILSSGRHLTIHFIRALHVSTAIGAIDHAFRLAASPQTLMVFSFGPHDTSWLVFRRAMPGFRKSHTGMWHHARTYWNRFTTTLVHYISFRLRMFELRGNGFVNDDSPASYKAGQTFRNAHVFRRPVVVFREQYLANCGHPKYTKYPLITRCGDLLMPTVIPHYRAYLAAISAVVNIPTVGLDELLQPSPLGLSGARGGRRSSGKPLCWFVDAGHMNRECHRYELQLLVQAFRATRRLGVVQGYSGVSPIFKVIEQAGLGSRWERVGEVVRLMPPYGYPVSAFSACHYRGVPLVDAVNASGDDDIPLCASRVATEPTVHIPQKKRWSQQQLSDAAKLFDAFDGASLELDVGNMDCIDIHEQRRTRCARSHLWASPFQNDNASEADDNVATDGSDATPTQPPAAQVSSGGVPPWVTFVASTSLMIGFALYLYRV